MPARSSGMVYLLDDEHAVACEHVIKAGGDGDFRPGQLSADLDEDLGTADGRVHPAGAGGRFDGTDLAVRPGTHQGTGEAGQAKAERVAVAIAVAVAVAVALERVAGDGLPVTVVLHRRWCPSPRPPTRSATGPLPSREPYPTAKVLPGMGTMHSTSSTSTCTPATPRAQPLRRQPAHRIITKRSETRVRDGPTARQAESQTRSRSAPHPRGGRRRRREDATRP